MTVGDRKRALALAGLFAEDVAIATGLGSKLPQEFRDLCEAVAMAVFASGQLERTATTGAIVYCASRIPPGPPGIHL